MECLNRSDGSTATAWARFKQRRGNLGHASPLSGELTNRQMGHELAPCRCAGKMIAPPAK